MSSETTRFCASCGAPRTSPTLRYCGQCGAAFVATVSRVEPDLSRQRRRPRLLVAALGLLGSSAYAFVWLWMSARELQNLRRDRSIRPFGHALTMFLIPLYGSARFYAHFRMIDRMLANVRSPVRAGAAVLTFIFTALIAVLYGSIIVAVAEPGMAGRALSVMSLLVVALGYAFIVETGQWALNAYYAAAAPTVAQRIRVIDYVLVAAFAVLSLSQLTSAWPAP